MTRPAGMLDPIANVSGEPRQDEVEAVHDELRRQILHNEMPSGTRINQAVVARTLCVSRGPVREALRLLQREGLVAHVHQHQMRVSSVSVSDLEQLYAMRITLEAFAVRITVPKLLPGDFDQLDAQLSTMDSCAAAGDASRWEETHAEFHVLLWSHAGERIDEELRKLSEYSARYRRLYLQGQPLPWADAAKDHRAIVDAAKTGDAHRASACHGTHLGKAALTVAAIVDPSHDPSMVREAIREAARAG